jgi:sterol 14alpha-demethylase
MQVMERETASWIADLGSSGKFEVFEAFSRLVLSITLNTLLRTGDSRAAQYHRAAPQHACRGDGFSAAAQSAAAQVPPPRPRTCGADRARRTGGRCAPVRYSPPRPLSPDAGRGCVYLTESGRRRESIIDLVLMTAFAGYITTAAQICWSLIELIEHPAYEQTVKEEIDALPADQNFGLDSFARLPRLEWAIKEAQRLDPVMSHYARLTACPMRSPASSCRGVG